MSRTSKLTPEIELEIAEKYRAGEKAHDIQFTYNIGGKDMYEILAKHGVEKRRPNRKPAMKKRHCDCGAVMPGEAKFCYMCGSSLKTDEEIIIDNLLKARAKCLSQCTAGIRNDVDTAIMAAVELLKEKCGVE